MTEGETDNGEPRVSANQLAEFISASPVRKEGIVRQAMLDDTPAGVRYGRARTAIANYFVDPRRDSQILLTAIRKLKESLIIAEKMPIGKPRDFAVSDCTLSLDALNHVLGAGNALPFFNYKINAADLRPPKILIEGVAVSVRPDILISKEIKGTIKTGGVIFSFSKQESTSNDKSRASRKERLINCAELLKLYFDTHSNNENSPDRRLCIAVDLFMGESHEAPLAVSERFANIHASCRSIADIWRRPKR